MEEQRSRRLFEILVREHADMLMAYLRSLVRAGDVVDDLFQQTMLVAWRRLDDFDQERPFGPWLRGIAGRLVMEQRRKKAEGMLTCEPEVIEALDRRFETIGKRPGDTFRERLDRLGTCLGRLPASFREVIELTYARGLMLKQVAEAVGEGEEAVKKRVQRARLMLADCLTASEPPAGGSEARA